MHIVLQHKKRVMSMRNKMDLSKFDANKLLTMILDNFDEWRASGNEDFPANLSFVESMIRQEKQAEEDRRSKKEESL